VKGTCLIRIKKKIIDIGRVENKDEYLLNEISLIWLCPFKMIKLSYILQWKKIYGCK